MTAQQIKQLLAARHANDVFFTEVKTGRSTAAEPGELGIMDAWAMKKSWEHPRIMAYEIKVDRSDFLNDNKWPKYLDYCNEFYFVCPHGLIEQSELPDKVGLIYVNKKGSGFRTIRKAAYRIDINPDPVFRYLLFNHAGVPAYRGPECALEWKEWAKEKQKIHLYGRTASKHIAQAMDELRQWHLREQDKIAKVETAEAIIKQFQDMTGEKITSSWQIKNAFERFMNPVRQRIDVNTINRMRSMLDKLQEWHDHAVVKTQEHDLGEPNILDLFAKDAE